MAFEMASLTIILLKQATTLSFDALLSAGHLDKMSSLRYENKAIFLHMNA